jgi:hypothetical protein
LCGNPNIVCAQRQGSRGLGAGTPVAMGACMRLALLALSACAGSLGPDTIPLEPSRIRSIAAGWAGGATRFCPTGSLPQLAVRVDAGARGRLETWAYGPGGVAGRGLDFDLFAWTVSVGTVRRDGIYLPPVDATQLLARPIDVRVVLRADPSIAADTTLEPTFDCGALVVLAGADGARGAAGSAGVAGMPGADGDPPGNGAAGGSGGDGGPGAPGGRGPDVLVEIARAGRVVVARIDVAGEGTRRVLVLDPAGKQLHVAARGGAGGAGGAPGPGGPGGAGGASTAGGTGGMAGPPGADGAPGRGGAGGAGGSILVRFPAAEPDLARLVVGDTQGGPGGAPWGVAGRHGPPLGYEPEPAAAP